MDKAQADYTAFVNSKTQFQAWVQKYQRQDHPLPASLGEFVNARCANDRLEADYAARFVRFRPVYRKRALSGFAAK